MISLPSTTRVDRRLPKEAFYSHLKLNAKQKDEFVHVIDQIRIANSIKPTTMHLADGEIAHEILVIDVLLKQEQVPESALCAIAQANDHQLVFNCIYGDKKAYAVYRKGELWTTDWHADGDMTLAPQGPSLDEVWDSFCGGIVFGDCSITDIDARIERERAIRALDEEIAKLERKHGNEKQPLNRNELFKQLKEARARRDALMEG